jgi:hypothetical protein
MAAVAAVDDRDGVQWRWLRICSILQQRLTAFDGVGDGLRREDERVAQGHAKQQPTSMMRCREGGATRGRQEMMARQPAGTTRQREAARRDDETKRGREGGTGRNERTRRDDATTSWRDELTRGWRNEMTARGYTTTSWHDKTTRGQCNERTRRGNVTTSWHDKLTRGRHNERTTNDKRLVIGHGIGGKVSQLKWCDSLKASCWNKRQQSVLVTRSHSQSTSDGSEDPLTLTPRIIGDSLRRIRLKYLTSY